MKDYLSFQIDITEINAQYWVAQDGHKKYLFRIDKVGEHSYRVYRARAKTPRKATSLGEALYMGINSTKIKSPMITYYDFSVEVR